MTPSTDSPATATASEPLPTVELQAVLDEAPPRAWWRRTMVWAGAGVVVLAGVG